MDFIEEEMRIHLTKEYASIENYSRELFLKWFWRKSLKISKRQLYVGRFWESSIVPL